MIVVHSDNCSRLRCHVLRTVSNLLSVTVRRLSDAVRGALLDTVCCPGYGVLTILRAGLSARKL